ncbi:MAG: cysteine desulfurase [Planctomycetota bacterium]|nr:MAG: cysteine desulfurase [Planctomycetota bacterium]
MQEVYLDNAASTRTDPAIAERLARDSLELWANPSSIHRPGLAARQRLEQARAAIAERVPGYRVVFTASGSEAINLAVRGGFACRARGTHRVLVSAVEHKAVLGAAAATTAEGAELTRLPVEPDGRLDLAELERLLRAHGGEVALLAVMAVQNEIGTRMPLAEVGALVRRHAPQALFVVDAVQALGKCPVDPAGWGAAAVAFSSHKVHGPKGVGCLLVREGVRLRPLVFGGGQEHGLRSGTEDVPGAAGFAAAFAAAWDGLERHRAALEPLRERLREGLLAACPEAIVHGPADPEARSPAILSLAFPGVPAEVLIHALEQDRVYVAAGSACQSGKRRNHVHEALGLAEPVAAGTVRYSLSWTSTAAEVERAVACTAARLAELRAAGVHQAVGRR